MTVVTRNPSATYKDGEWEYPERAYFSNDDRTVAGAGNETQGYKGYGFNIPSGAVITKVEIGLEGKISGLTTSIQNGYRVDGNEITSIRYQGCIITETDELLKWLDITAEQTWTPTLLDDDHLRVLLEHYMGAGCYPLECEVGLWLGGLKLVRDIKLGDLLTGWDEKKLKSATVTYFKIHYGKWKVLRLIAESVHRKGDFKDTMATPEHLIPYAKIKFEDFDEVTEIEVEAKTYEDIVLGDYLFGYIERKVSRMEHFEPYKVVKILKKTVNAVADIRTNVKWFMSHFLMAKKIPTGYCDSIPWRVTYTTVEAKIQRMLTGVGL